MYEVVLSETIQKFDRSSWNHLIEDDHPFVKHEFFDSLEQGRCVGAGTGWKPLYFAAYKDQVLKAVCFLFLKTDSFGEFIFDWAWAQAYQQHRLAYYPKLTSAVPYSPVSAPKFLGDLEVVQKRLLPEVEKAYQSNSFSGLHFLFTSKEEGDLLKTMGLKERDSFQYHWISQGQESFDDFLSTLKRSRRKTILKERRQVLHHQLETQEKKGRDVTGIELDFFYECYLSTIEKKWSNAYLTKTFFEELFKQLPDNLTLILVSKDHQLVASALYLHSDSVLFGRYWGCLEEFGFLHFEVCLYRGIEMAIEKKFKRFEAGAQGEHKRLRGFVPVKTKSWHHLKHPDFFRAVEEFIDQESAGVDQLFEHFDNESAFKKDTQ